jgi:biopolymer transport protein ExbB/TolQ
MSDRLATLLVFALIGTACFVIAAAPHLAAYTALVTWAAKLLT